MKEDRVIKIQYLFIYLAGANLTFLNIYFKGIGFSGTQIGIIGALTPVIAVFALPVWGLICDMYNARNIVIMIMMIASIIVNLLYMTTNNFYIIILIALVGSIFQLNPSVDSNTMAYLKDRGNKFGEFRLWGSFGFAVSAFFVGLMTQKVGIKSIFIAYAVCMLIALMFTMRVPKVKAVKVKDSTKKDMKKQLKELLTNKQFIIFLALILVSQFAASVVDSYFSLFMKDINAPNSIIGFSLTVSAFSELPVFILTPKLISKFGSKKLMMFALSVYAVRLFLYSIIKNPYIILFVQLSNGLCFPPLIAASVNIVNDLAPEKLKSTAQYIFNLVYRTLVAILGNLIGGRLYDLIGTQLMYRYFSIILVLSVFGTMFLVKEKKKHGMQFADEAS